MAVSPNEQQMKTMARGKELCDRSALRFQHQSAMGDKHSPWLSLDPRTHGVEWRPGWDGPYHLNTHKIWAWVHSCNPSSKEAKARGS